MQPSSEISQASAGHSPSDSSAFAADVMKPSSRASQSATGRSPSDAPKPVAVEATPSSAVSGAAEVRPPADSAGVVKSASATDDSAASARRHDDGSQAARDAASSDGTVSKASAYPSADQIARWQIPEYKPLVLLACRDGFAEPALLDMAISPSGKQFVLAGSKLTLWNTKDTRPALDLLAKYTSDDIERPLLVVGISDDGKWIAAGDQKGRVRIWSLSDQREVLKLEAHPGRITQLAFSPNSQLLATTSYSGEINLWQLPDGKRIKSLEVSNEEITRLAFLSDDVLAAASNEVSLWVVASGKKADGPLEQGLQGYGLCAFTRSASPCVQ